MFGISLSIHVWQLQCDTVFHDVQLNLLNTATV